MKRDKIEPKSQTQDKIEPRSKGPNGPCSLTLQIYSFCTLASSILSFLLSFCQTQVMREMQENYYLTLFMFASQLYFYILGPCSLLGY